MQNVFSKNQKWECKNYDRALKNIQSLMDASVKRGFDIIFTRYIASNNLS